MYNQKFNNFCLLHLVEAADDYFRDQTYFYDTKGAKEFMYHKPTGVLIVNAGGGGSTHSNPIRTLLWASQGKIEPNEDGLYEVDGPFNSKLLYDIKGDPTRVKSVDEEGMILGRFWEVPSSRINDMKPFAFWMYNVEVPKGESAANKFIKENVRHIKTIWDKLDILPREYYYQFNQLEHLNHKEFKTFEQIYMEM